MRYLPCLQEAMLLLLPYYRVVGLLAERNYLSIFHCQP